MGDEMMILLDRLDKIEGKLGDEYGELRTVMGSGFTIEGEGILEIISTGVNTGNADTFDLEKDGTVIHNFMQTPSSGTYGGYSSFVLPLNIKFKSKIKLLPRAKAAPHMMVLYRLKKED